MVRDWRQNGSSHIFPPEVVVRVKALACELPSKFGVPLSRWSTEDLAARVHQSGLEASISGITIWRWLMRMPFDLGSTVAGFFRVIQTSRKKRAGFDSFDSSASFLAGCLCRSDPQRSI